MWRESWNCWRGGRGEEEEERRARERGKKDVFEVGERLTFLYPSPPSLAPQFSGLRGMQGMPRERDEGWPQHGSIESREEFLWRRRERLQHSLSDVHPSSQPPCIHNHTTSSDIVVLSVLADSSEKMRGKPSIHRALARFPRSPPVLPTSVHRSPPACSVRSDRSYKMAVGPFRHLM